MIKQKVHNTDYATITQAKENKEWLWLWLCLGMGALLFLRSVNDIFLYPAFVFGVLAVLISNANNGLCILFFTLPFGPIFKTSPESFSFFTILFIAYVAKSMVKRQFNIKTFFLAILLGFYLLAFSGTGEIITIITMLVGVFLVYFSTNQEDVKFDNTVISYSLGILLSSIIGLMQENLPIVERFVISRLSKLGEGNYVNRFSGLHGNPNYFTVDVIIVLAALAILIMQNKKNMVAIVLFGTLSVIGLLSISKSFLLSWLMLIFWMFISSFQLNVGKIVKILLLICCLFVVVYFFSKESIDLYLVRFLGNTNESFSDMTTGRADIWQAYMREIFASTKNVFFGKGIGAELVNQKGAHNTYIELWYMLGLFGGILYLCTIGSCIKLKNKKILLICYAPLVVFLARLCAIGTLLYDSIWFYIIIAILALKFDIATFEREKV